MPIKNNTMPKILSSIYLYSNKILPKLDAAAPRNENAIEKPAVKNRELITAFLVAFLLSLFESSLAEKPEIKDKYPGKRGSTHGVKKDAKPAAKAVIYAITI